MSERWGPRAHPERCDDEFSPEAAHRRMDTHFRWVWLILALVLAGWAIWRG